MARAQAHTASQMYAAESTFLRATVSARAPAGRIKTKKGRVAAVDIRERSNVDRLMLFITQVAAISCADTKVPETTVASQSLRKVGFCKARQLEVSVIVTKIITSSKIHQLDAAAIAAEIALFDGNDRRRGYDLGCFPQYSITPTLHHSARLDDVDSKMWTGIGSGFVPKGLYDGSQA
jgi:hypothetical protein